jgi:hypothetical protein
MRVSYINTIREDCFVNHCHYCNAIIGPSYLQAEIENAILIDRRRVYYCTRCQRWAIGDSHIEIQDDTLLDIDSVYEQLDSYSEEHNDPYLSEHEEGIFNTIKNWIVEQQNTGINYPQIWTSTIAENNTNGWPREQDRRRLRLPIHTIENILTQILCEELSNKSLLTYKWDKVPNGSYIAFGCSETFFIEYKSQSWHVDAYPKAMFKQPTSKKVLPPIEVLKALDAYITSTNSKKAGERNEGNP